MKKNIHSKELMYIIGQKMGDLKKYGVKRIGLFGSYARGEDTLESDVDILVEFEKGEKNYNNFMEVYFFLKDLTGKEVDLLTPESISPYIKPYILKEVVFI